MINTSRAILALAVLSAAALLAPRLDFVPMWDGWAYAECAIDVAANQFAPYFLRCYGHPAYVYAGLLGVSQLMDPGNPALMLLVNATLFGAGAIGFHRLMRRAFPGAEHDTDTALVTAAFVLQPAFLAAVIQPSLDLPVLVGSVWCMVLLIERRWVWCALVGMAMAFSKETGLLLYGVLLGCHAIWFVARADGTLIARLRALLPTWPTGAPFVAYAGYVITFLVLRPGQSPIWASGTVPFGVNIVSSQTDAGLASYLSLLFILNFAWIPVIWLVAAVVFAVGRRIAGRIPRPIAGSDPRVIGFLTLAAVAVIFALTRIITYSNVRYLMAGTAALLALAFVALIRLPLAPGVRRATLGVYVVLLGASVVRTVDPVSKWRWGTFSFGSHEMLDMTTITGECCGAGRDQLTYSLEFTRLHDMTDSVVASLMRGTTTGIVIPARMRYHTIGRIDRSTWKTTLQRDGAFEPDVMTGPVVLIRRSPPRSLIYVALPNGKDSTSLAELSGAYDVGPERRFEANGYAISAYPMQLKSSSPSTP